MNDEDTQFNQITFQNMPMNSMYEMQTIFRPANRMPGIGHVTIVKQNVRRNLYLLHAKYTHKQDVYVKYLTYIVFLTVSV